MHLIENDDMWINCMEEAITLYTATSCTNLLIAILCENEVANPRDMLDRYQDFLMKDFLYRRQQQQHQHPHEVALNDLLFAIQQGLQMKGKMNSDMDLPEPNYNLVQQADLMAELIDPTADSFFSENEPKLYEEQRSFLNRVLQLLENDEDGFLFLDAPGGCGKTFVLNVLIAGICRQSKVVFSTAASGIAAILLRNGTTSHKRFKFPIPIFEDSTCSIPLQSPQAQQLRDAAVLILDEITMLHRYNTEALDRYLKVLMSNDQLFGGKIVIVAGDGRQTLPIVRRGSRSDIVDSVIFKSELWTAVEKFKLSKNMRIQRILQEGDPHETEERLQLFNDKLLEIGEGRHTRIMDNIIQIDTEMICETAQQLIEEVYDTFNQQCTDPDYFKKRAILTGTNSDVKELNESLLHQVPGETKTYLSIDSCMDPDDAAYVGTEVLNNIEMSGMPEHRLLLKVGAIIILIRNLHVHMKDVNGTRYIITALSSNLITAKKLGATADEPLLLIPRVIHLTKNDEFPFIMKRDQFPVKLAYVMTFQRAQGQSLDKCGILLNRSVWTHGQLYVAMSRCGAMSRVKIYANQAEFEELNLPPNNHYTRNVVYTEVFT